MIKVEIFRDDDDRILGFRASGHADYASTGEDIVCSAVSMLTINSANSLEHYLGAEKVQMTSSKEIQVECFLVPENLTKDDWIRAEVILGTLTMGLRDVEKAYGKHVKISNRRCATC